jgi:hypothetical protein
MSFPVDDVTLNAIEHALQGCWVAVDPDGTHHWGGSDYSLSQLLNFLSGYDSDKLELLEEGEGTGWHDAPIYTYPEAIYSEHDVIRALIDEVRRLRGEQ